MTIKAALDRSTIFRPDGYWSSSVACEGSSLALTLASATSVLEAWVESVSTFAGVGFFSCESIVT
ncbi:hypothetical protein VDGD_21303 [Verticillium dahliae]|nr:hypothetical protein VDGD_21303 [Verticillium dahliae]